MFSRYSHPIVDVGRSTQELEPGKALSKDFTDILFFPVDALKAKQMV
jgi:hypothetical protein